MAFGTAALPEVEMLDEERDIVLWRLDQFRRLGFGDDESWKLAFSEADLGQARRLCRTGCSVELAFSILA
jgi:hypothetical protein